MTFEINLKTNIDEFSRKISAFAYQQLPFATAQALTALAKAAVLAEQKNEVKVLDRPKPFTQNAIGVIAATKSRQEATVFMKDITAAYLRPYQFGGTNVLNSRALIKPIDAVKDLDQFGNLPRNFIKKLKGRSDIFIGAIRTRNGLVNGVWQRSVVPGASVGRITKTGKFINTRKSVNTTGKLILLVKFQDAHPARQYLDWFNVANHTIAREFNREMGRALARAIASAK